MLLFIIITLILCFNNINNTEFVPGCYYSNKYIGNFYFKKGMFDHNHFLNSSRSNSEECKIQCLNHPLCRGIQLKNSSSCELFNTTNIKKTGLFNIGVYYRCKFNSEPPNRCKGEMVQYYNKKIVIEGYSPLRNIMEVKDYQDCRKICIDIPMCGFIVHNTTNKLCSLLQFWGSPQKFETNDTSTGKWVCSNDSMNKIPINYIENLKLKCDGYYNITGRGISKQFKGYNTFRSMNYKDCLEECNNLFDCTKVWYSFENFTCILNVIRNDKNRNLTYKNLIEFNLACLNNQSTIIKSNKEIWLESNGIKCNKLISNVNLVIANKTNCNVSLPDASEFIPCALKSVNSKVWLLSDNCRINQSFWIIPFNFKATRLINNKYYTKFIRIYTGLTTFWLGYIGELNDTFQESNILTCRAFDGSLEISPSLAKDIKFYKRKHWFAMSPKDNETKYYKTPAYISISSTITSSCATLNACTYLLRVLQYNAQNLNIKLTLFYYDIPFNFLIDESGNIYEGRGWDNIDASDYFENDHTISIALIGSTEYILPPLAYLKSLKYLIKLARNRGSVIKNFTIYLHGDVATAETHINLQNVIKYYERYRNFEPMKCKINQWYAALIINIGLFLIFLIFLKNIKSYLKMRSCSKCFIINNEQYEFNLLFSNSKECNKIKNVNFDLEYQDYIIIEKSNFMGNKLLENLSKKIHLLWVHFLLSCKYKTNENFCLIKYLYNNLVLHVYIKQNDQCEIGLVQFKIVNEIKRIFLFSTTYLNLNKLKNDLIKNICVCKTHYIIDLRDLPCLNVF